VASDQWIHCFTNQKFCREQGAKSPKRKVVKRLWGKNLVMAEGHISEVRVHKNLRYGLSIQRNVWRRIRISQFHIMEGQREKSRGLAK
jgi:hypothetical protein